MGVQRTTEEWAEIVEAFRNSGQTMATFCSEREINIKTLRNHVYRSSVGIEGSIKRRSPKEWSALIEAQRDSGMTMADWCRQNGIVPDTMRTAAGRLKRSSKALDETKWVELNRESEHNKAVVEKNDESLKPPSGDSYTQNKPVSGNGMERQGCSSVKSGMKIRAGKLEIEVDISYPVEKLSILIERLAR